MADAAESYQHVQERLIAVVTDPSTTMRTRVPACPAWSVHDVLAHHTGYIADVAAGNFPEFSQGQSILNEWRDAEVARARDAMTARQVTERADRSVESLVTEWQKATPSLLELLSGQRPEAAPFGSLTGSIALNDLVVHETDIRSALGLTRAAESPALSMALAGYGMSLSHRIRSLGLPALVLAYAGMKRRIGDGEPGAQVRADRHELLRVMAGRRTREQILTLDWEGDPLPYLSILSEFGLADTPTTD
ncbi:maleylpyruvate isomerase family mycothiol-dependent enzyme [Streptomyces sp. N2-109]|uniref:Maleylpyruvate isomerase family mycothiol-dependent enzyme n=1 Tax=Streptomyces gossypii TaxID=2883101 RepID=A0ABT2JVY2_9ACTN|nr:maleylpyruvate isomerase family mycothiol-dependent enzyme [Streptomyces gossypii]MCT2592041.1 maleylpyruvate isomerase family mycothiol-dependent enzyme [Streptomyces gossypii]